MPFGYAALMNSSIDSGSATQPALRPCAYDDVEPGFVEQDGETYQLLPLGAARFVESRKADPLEYLIAQEEREALSFFPVSHLSNFLAHRVTGQERHVLTLFFFTNMSRAEIARTLRLSEEETERIRLAGIEELKAYVASVRGPGIRDGARLCA